MRNSMSALESFFAKLLQLLLSVEVGFRSRDDHYLRWRLPAHASCNVMTEDYLRRRCL